MVKVSNQFAVRLTRGAEAAVAQAHWQRLARDVAAPFCERDPRWLASVCTGLRHVPYMLEALRGSRLAGILPLAFVQSLLFGRYLVSLPYVSSGGVIAEDESTAAALIDRAVELADELDVRYLELRHEVAHDHPKLTHRFTNKVHMRLELPDTADGLWTVFNSKVRNQVRKAEQQDLTILWGATELLPDFYSVFSRNMRDLGTPVFGRGLFRSILGHFGRDAELCCLRLAGQPVASALIVHGSHMTEVPSASSLRCMNHTNANMLMYWHLLRRSIDRGQSMFDFGRSTVESSTYRFKKQWGAHPEPAVWQYYVRKGQVDDMKLENDKYRRAVRIWQALPVGLTRLIGPFIVRGIP